MRTRMYGGVTGKAGDRLPMSIAAPDGAADAWPNRLDLYCESMGQDTSAWWV